MDREEKCGANVLTLNITSGKINPLMMWIIYANICTSGAKNFVRRDLIVGTRMTDRSSNVRISIC